MICNNNNSEVTGNVAQEEPQENHKEEISVNKDMDIKLKEEPQSENEEESKSMSDVNYFF